jgi:hypothetical protein
MVRCWSCDVLGLTIQDNSPCLSKYTTNWFIPSERG